MMYYAVFLILGILLLLLYYSRLDAIERNYNFEFKRRDDNQFPRVLDVWLARKEADSSSLKTAILILIIIRIVSTLAIVIPFLLFITFREK